MMKNIAFVLTVIFTIGWSQNKTYNEILDSYNISQNFSGVALVASNYEVDFVGSVGMGNRANNTPINTHSKFKIASMSKTFTAILIMKLVQENKINLNNTIGAYYPEYKGIGKDKVTIHNLLTYSSGIKNLAEPLEMQSYQNILTLDEYIDTYCSGELVYTPGEKSEYGNTEYIILHKIIELLYGKSFEKCLKDEILIPLKMKSTGVVRNNKKIKGLVNSYLYNDSIKDFSNESPYYSSMFFGAGCMYSTANDIMILSKALFNNKILNQDITNNMLTIHENLGYTAYSLWGSNGWGTFDEKFYYRTGGILGSNSNWIQTIDKKKTIIILSNNNATNLYQLSEELYLRSLTN